MARLGGERQREAELWRGLLGWDVEIFSETPDFVWIRDEGFDFHWTGALWTKERIQLEDLFHEPGPIGRRPGSRFW